MEGITYVKSDEIVLGAAGTSAIEVDLGLGIDEAAKILGLNITVYPTTIFTAPLYISVEAVYSFDPEDTAIDNADDEQFAYTAVVTSDITASTGAQKQSETIFMDFTKMNLVTTRNLAFICTAVGLKATAVGKVYYEKFKPTDRELVTLIAQRR